MRRILLTLGAGAIVAGCATASTAQRPTQQLSETKAAIGVADQMGASQVPTAQLHLALARENLQLAERWLEEGENAKATWALESARSDARLAMLLTRETSLRVEAQRALDRAHQLRPTPAPKTGGAR